MVIMLLPIICFWQIDFVFSGIFAVFAGTIHVFAGVSNHKMIKDFDKIHNIGKSRTPAPHT